MTSDHKLPVFHRRISIFNMHRIARHKICLQKLCGFTISMKNIVVLRHSHIKAAIKSRVHYYIISNQQFCRYSCITIYTACCTAPQIIVQMQLIQMAMRAGGFFPVKCFIQPGKCHGCTIIIAHRSRKGKFVYIRSSILGNSKTINSLQIRLAGCQFSINYSRANRRPFRTRIIKITVDHCNGVGAFGHGTNCSALGKLSLPGNNIKLYIWIC